LGEDHDCERVPARLQLGSAVLVVGELHHRVVHVQRERPAASLIAIAPAARAGIGEHGQADDLSAPAVVDPAVLLEHPAPDVCLRPLLDLDVGVDGGLRVAPEAHLDELVGQPFAASGTAQDDLELLVKGLVALRPIDIPVNRGGRRSSGTVRDACRAGPSRRCHLQWLWDGNVGRAL